jgi:hypothetical protein
MDENTMPRLRKRQRLVWMAIAYVVVTVLVLCPAFHEELGARLFLWNCIPATLGLLVLATTFGKSRPRVVASVTFALLTAGITKFFSVAWFFTPLDLDPHSAITKLFFIFAPMFSLSLATTAAAFA